MEIKKGEFYKVLKGNGYLFKGQSFVVVDIVSGDSGGEVAELLVDGVKELNDYVYIFEKYLVLEKIRKYSVL